MEILIRCWYMHLLYEKAVAVETEQGVPFYELYWVTSVLSR